MKWRLLKLNWKYGIGELAIVTMGVLIALGVDEWRQQHQHQSCEDTEDDTWKDCLSDARL